METTLELPEDLLGEATAVATRGITLNAFVEHCLVKELASPSVLSPEESQYFKAGPLGILQLQKRGANITNEDVRRFIEEYEEEDFRRALILRDGLSP